MRSTLRIWLPAIGQLAVLLIVALLLLWPAPVTRNQLFAAWLDSDLMLSHWPTALLIQRTFAQSHTLPLWNPYFGGGQPLGADPLAALFYPPTQLVHFFPLRDYFLVLVLGHLVWAGLGMLLLARCAVGLPRLPALVAAVSYMAMPGLMSHLGAGHVTFVQTVAWYPWLALACWATVRDPRRWGVMLGLCIAWTILAGHPQMAYYGLLMTVALAAWLLMKRWLVEGWRALIASVAGSAVAGIVGVLLAAIHLLPLMEFTTLSTRQLALKILDAYPLMSFLHALFFPQPPSAHMWESVISPGLAVLFLAIIAILTRLRRAWPLVLGIVAVAELAMGNASSLYLRVVHILPGLDRLRDPVRIWFIALVPICLLAGLGADSLIRGIQFILHRVAQGVMLRRVGTLVAGCLLVFFAALSLLVTDIGYARVGDVSTITTPSVLARSAAQLAGDGRIYGAQENILQLYAAELQVPFADGFDPLLIGSYVSYMLRAGGFAYAGGYVLHFPTDIPAAQPDARLLGLMNVRVVVSSKPLTDPRLVLVEKVDGTLIYRNTAAAGSAYLVAPGSDGRPPTLNQLQRLGNNVRVITLAPEQEIFTLTTTSPGYLVLATPVFPGWVAELDNQPAAVQQIAGVLPAIKVAPGKHTLSYTYTPSSVRYGAMLTAVGLLATLVWFIVGWFWKPRGSWKEGGMSLKPSPEATELLVDPVTKSTSGSTDPDV